MLYRCSTWRSRGFGLQSKTVCFHSQTLHNSHRHIFSPDSPFFSPTGFAHNTQYRYDLSDTNGTGRVLGEHDDAVKCTNYCADLGKCVLAWSQLYFISLLNWRTMLVLGLIATASWDKTLRLWDPRQQNALVQTIPLADKYVYDFVFICNVYFLVLMPLLFPFM